jgi:hypothetical protein
MKRARFFDMDSLLCLSGLAELSLALALFAQLSLADFLFESHALCISLKRNNVDKPLTTDVRSNDFTLTREASDVVS